MPERDDERRGLRSEQRLDGRQVEVVVVVVGDQRPRRPAGARSAASAPGAAGWARTPATARRGGSTPGRPAPAARRPPAARWRARTRSRRARRPRRAARRRPAGSGAPGRPTCRSSCICRSRPLRALAGGRAGVSSVLWNLPSENCGEPATTGRSRRAVRAERPRQPPGGPRHEADGRGEDGGQRGTAEQGRRHGSSVPAEAANPVGSGSTSHLRGSGRASLAPSGPGPPNGRLTCRDHRAEPSPAEHPLRDPQFRWFFAGRRCR